MFENLQVKLEKAFKTLKGQGKISEINVAETVKEIRKALLDADVSYKVAKDFTNEVKEKALGQNVMTSISPGQLMTKIVHDELVTLLGGTAAEINLKGNPSIILMAGLQGSGKTTFSGKLAAYLKSKGKKPLLVAGDVYRPAAIDQLKVLGAQIEVPVYADFENKNPVDIAKKAIARAKSDSLDTVIIDTAGRLSIDEQMMKEISQVKAAVDPSEILFVVDAMTGQDAVNTAKAFNDVLNFSGVVLTKMDGDTRGGAALSVKAVVDRPVKFISNGEKLDAITVFHPDRMANRILGMGDIVSLVEKAQANYDREEAERMQRKFNRNEFNFDDFHKQLQQIKKMGNLKDLMGMIPGVGKAIKDIDISDDAFKGVEAIICSMTPQERQKPELLNGSRRKRIADGSGTTVTEVNKLIKQFEEMQKMMKSMNKMRGMGLGKMPFG